MAGSRGGDPYTRPPTPPPGDSSPPVPGGPGGEPDPCGRLMFDATLSSPEPAVVEVLVVGELLGVMLATADGVRLVEVRTADGRLAGTLMTNLPELLACLGRGVDYLAEVRSVDGGAVRLAVRPGRPPACGDIGFSVTVRTGLPTEALPAVGDVLDLRRGAGLVEAWTSPGVHVGDFGDGFTLLSPCLAGGHEVVAEVRGVSGGEVVLEVRSGP